MVEATIEEVADYVSRGRSPRYVPRSDLPVINQRCIRWEGIDEQHVKFVRPSAWDLWSDERYVRNQRHSLEFNGDRHHWASDALCWPRQL